MNTIVILRGPSAVGKSTISRLIQEKLGINWTVLDVDKFKHYMPLKDGQSNRAERSKIAHDVSKFFTKEMYEKGYDIIMEEMYKKPYNDSLLDFLHQNNMQFVKVFLWAPIDMVVARNAAREKTPTEEEIRRHYSEIEPYGDDLVIDTTKHSSEEAADLIIAEVEKLNKG
jgi:adenylylsulfate kinase-like enzyme